MDFVKAKKLDSVCHKWTINVDNHTKADKNK